MKLKKYRIVEDDYNGYEAQVWRVWFPFWVQMWDVGSTNTHPSIEKAEEFIENKNKRKQKPSRFVKYVENVKDAKLISFIDYKNKKS